MRTNRLGGHALRDEGRTTTDPYFDYLSNGEGRARCQCGAQSAVLENTAARKRWHREHKDSMRGGR